MELFAITRPGLLGIAASVLALWGCIAAEKATIREGQRDAIASMRQLRRLRNSPVPVSYPVGRSSHKSIQL